MCGCFWCAGILLLVLLPAPASLGKVFDAPCFDDFLPQALVGLVGGDVVDAGMVVPGVLGSKVSIEVGDGVAVIEEAAGIFGRAFDGAEGGLDEGVVVGGSRAGEHLGHVVILAEPARF